MTKYILDTNTVSYLVRGHPIVLNRLTNLPNASVCVSTITEGELRFGIARKPAATRLRHSIETFLRSTDILPWDSAAAKQYASLRAAKASVGRDIGALDLLIAAHAMSAGRVLVTSDKALLSLQGPAVEDWTQTA